MVQGDRFVDTSLGGRERLIRVSLEPEDRRDPRPCRDPGIELEADDVWHVHGGPWAIEDTREMSPRIRLFAQQMQRQARHTVTDRRGKQMRRIRCHSGDSLGKTHSLSYNA